MPIAFPTAFAAKSLSELVARVGESPDTGTRVRIVGHSNGQDLAFAGSIDLSTGDILFPDLVNQMNKKTVETDRKFIKEVTPKRFLRDTEIWLYGCHSGNYALGDFMQGSNGQCSIK